MGFNRLTLTLVGACGLAWQVAAADSLSIQLKPQTEINQFDLLADLTQGTLQWSHGAFLFVGSANGVNPWFHTLDREGRVVSSATLTIPEGDSFWFGGHDRAPDGSIVFAGGAYAVSGEGTPFIAWISPDGVTERVLRTAPYHVYMLSIAPDGTLWTIGSEMINHRPDAAGVDQNAGILRHFDRTGKLMGSFFPQARFLWSQQLASGFLIAKSDRLVWYGPKFGGPGKYVEIPLNTMTMEIHAGMAKLPDHAHISSFAVTDDGTALLSVNYPGAPRLQSWVTYMFDRAQSRWSAIQMPAGQDVSYHKILGSDGDKLVIYKPKGAGFFSMSH